MNEFIHFFGFVSARLFFRSLEYTRMVMDDHPIQKYARNSRYQHAGAESAVIRLIRGHPGRWQIGIQTKRFQNMTLTAIK
ncbi:MAG: hypothetical protein H6618_05600 [Deltaproteobacteria bacterium]|nr:hypothetical protein [Deltaproteobacteria bacterium]